MVSGRNSGNQRRRGSAMVEFCFLLPWYVFLFAGVFDFGFYSCSLIATANAARVTAYYCAAKDGACTVANSDTTCVNYVVGQLKYLPNVGSAVTTCSAAPITMTIGYATGSCPDANPCVTATVAYVTPQLVPIPGLLPGQLTITKAVTLRLRG